MQIQSVSAARILGQALAPNDPHFLPMGGQTWWVCVLVGTVGCVVIGVIVVFVWGLFKSHEIFRWNAPLYRDALYSSLKDADGRANVLRYFSALYAESFHRMNEFWSAYLQVLVAALLVILLTILLLTKTITAEAGLPILSA